MTNFNNSKTIKESNDIFTTQIKDMDILKLSENEVQNLADFLLVFFRQNFENRNFIMLEEIAEYCKIVLDDMLDRRLYEKEDYAEIILDIACFVYDQMCMYEDEVKALKMIIESESSSDVIRIRALENILTPEPEKRNSIKNDIERYTKMLKQLSV